MFTLYLSVRLEVLRLFFSRNAGAQQNQRIARLEDLATAGRAGSGTRGTAVRTTSAWGSGDGCAATIRAPRRVRCVDCS
jgi:hypothetical protein